MDKGKANIEGQTSSYRSIFKATSLFGGVKIFEIIISILKSKIVAMLIGPAGVGFNGLLCSGSSLIQSATQLGLGQSAVRDVSEVSTLYVVFQIFRNVFLYIFYCIAVTCCMIGSYIRRTKLLGAWHHISFMNDNRPIRQPSMR